MYGYIREHDGNMVPIKLNNISNVRVIGNGIYIAWSIPSLPYQPTFNHGQVVIQFEPSSFDVLDIFCDWINAVSASTTGVVILNDFFPQLKISGVLKTSSQSILNGIRLEPADNLESACGISYSSMTIDTYVVNNGNSTQAPPSGSIILKNSGSGTFETIQDGTYALCNRYYNYPDGYVEDFYFINIKGGKIDGAPEPCPLTMSYIFHVPQDGVGQITDPAFTFGLPGTYAHRWINQDPNATAPNSYNGINCSAAATPDANNKMWPTFNLGGEIPTIGIVTPSPTSATGGQIYYSFDYDPTDPSSATWIEGHPRYSNAPFGEVPNDPAYSNIVNTLSQTHIYVDVGAGNNLDGYQKLWLLGYSSTGAIDGILGCS